MWINGIASKANDMIGKLLQIHLLQTKDTKVDRAHLTLAFIQGARCNPETNAQKKTTHASREAPLPVPRTLQLNYS